MKKKTRVIIFIFMCVFLVLAVVIYTRIPKSTKEPVSITPKTTTTPAVVEKTVWTDPAGFQFSYPKDITIDKHDEDQENYAHPELSSPTQKGSLIVWLKDAPLGTIEDWIVTQPEYKNVSSIDSTVAGLTGKKILIKTPKKQTVFVAISDELLYQIEANTDNAYWETVYADVTQSFSIGSSPEASTTDDSSTGEDTSEVNQASDEDVIEEEVVE